MNREIQAGPSKSSGRARRWGKRLAGTVLVALGVGWGSGTAMRWDARMAGPAGFGRGLLHGALMPLAWPTLLAGRDQEIYGHNNSGRTYKLGYSLGVNVCGAAFFGWSYSRWRRWAAQR